MMENAAHGKLKHAGSERSAFAADPAPKLLAAAAKSDRAEWTRRLEEAAQEVFELMVNVSLKRRDAQAGSEAFELCAMVGMAGDICGVLSLRCSGYGGRRIALSMLRRAVSEVDSNVLDAVGEVCNTIAGSFKAKIPGYSDGCLLSLPTVINGWNYVVHMLRECERIVVPVEMDNEPLSITLDLLSPLLC
jgi:chemotaxis protein CheX